MPELTPELIDELDQPKAWCNDLLDELAGTHNVGFTCGPQGSYRSHVNERRREFLEEVLGLADVDYVVCMYCDSFALKEQTDEWPYPAVCPGCESELPRAASESESE